MDDKLDRIPVVELSFCVHARHVNASSLKEMQKETTSLTSQANNSILILLIHAVNLLIT